MRTAPVKCDCPYRQDHAECHPQCKLYPFVKRLLNPDDLGYAVTQEVRDAARQALGRKA